jgi:hypothetical protein
VCYDRHTVLLLRSLFLFDFRHLLATADFLMRHGARAGAALHVDDFGFAGITTITITGLSRHGLSPLGFMSGSSVVFSTPAA